MRALAAKVRAVNGKVRAFAAKVRALNGKVRAFITKLRAVNESKSVRSRLRAVNENKSVHKVKRPRETKSISLGRFFSLKKLDQVED